MISIKYVLNMQSIMFSKIPKDIGVAILLTFYFQREREREREREIIFSSCRPIWLATQLRVFEEIINAYIYIW